jgi:hypothetical protein
MSFDRPQPPDPWGAWYAPWQSEVPEDDDYPGSEGYDIERIPDEVIRGLIDGYDDPHIDAVVFELIRLRVAERERTGAPEPPACEDCDHPGCRYMRGYR